MPRRSWVQVNGVLYEKGIDEIPGDSGERGRSAAVMGDLDSFTSPIYGTVVSGRAGLREHCRRHDVVPTAELKGLPPKPMVDTRENPQYREATRQTIANIINDRGYFRRK